MSSTQSKASLEALKTNKELAEGYYGIAIPALQGRIGEINNAMVQGEPAYLQQAYEGQRAGLTEGLAAKGGMAQAQQMAGAKKALSGGNQFAAFSPADIGSQLANALYGSKFQEGQANLNQQFNLMSMALGGAGTTGNAALNASGQQLQAINQLPGYNQGYANVVGGAAGAASIYGAMNKAGIFNWGGSSGGGGLGGGTSVPTSPYIA